MLACRFILLLSVLMASPLAALTPGDHWREFDLDNRHRSYLVHVPPNYDPAKPTPVVLIFHGATMNARMMVGFCGMSHKADAAGFLAVYPNGTGTREGIYTFNAWMAPTPGPVGPADDVKFTARVLDDLASIANVDPRRVFATGLSNGGFLCYRLGVALSDRIAAIAPVAGTLGVDPGQPARPVPVLHFHGTADPIVPFGGAGRFAGRLLKFRSVDQTIRTWVTLTGCEGAAAITEFPDGANDGTTVTRAAYSGGKDNSEVVLFTIHGGGHTWPGQPCFVPFLGKSTRNLSANDEIWSFFLRHPMPKGESRR